MLKSTQYLVICLVVVLSVVASATPTRSGYPRSNRGFKSQGLSTARGFGKRDPGTFMGPLVPGQPAQYSMENVLPPNFDVRSRSYPNNWLIEEMQANPEVIRLIVEKVVDENGDGELSPEELFRRIYF